MDKFISQEAAEGVIKKHCKKCIYNFITDPSKCPDCRLTIEVLDIRNLPTLTVQDALDIISDHCKSTWPACDSCELADWCEMVDSHISPRNWNERNDNNG